MDDINKEVKEQTIEDDEILVKETKDFIKVVDESKDNGSTKILQKKKLTKMHKIIIGAMLVVTLIIITIILIPSKLERVQDKCLEMAGYTGGTGKQYFSLDTDPIEDMDEDMRAILLPDIQKNTLEAIRYANEELGFSGAVYSDMMNTTALMGRQSEENKKYKVSWTYHPDRGLEVTYSKR